jgi:hypothetical protein
MSGNMNEIVLLPTWRRLFENFPSRSHTDEEVIALNVHLRTGGDGRVDPTHLPDDEAAFMRTLADRLRDWAPAIIKAEETRAGGHAPDIVPELEKHVQWLHGLAARTGSQRSRTQRWDSRATVFFFRAACALKNEGMLATVARAVAAGQLVEAGAVPDDVNLERRNANVIPATTHL